jgi:hypothetical protein
LLGKASGQSALSLFDEPVPVYHPDLDYAVVAAGAYPGAVRAEGDDNNPSAVLETAHFSAGDRAEYTRAMISAAGRQASAIRAERDDDDFGPMI